MERRNPRLEVLSNFPFVSAAKSEITTFVKCSICLFREILHSLSGGGVYRELILFPDNLLAAGSDLKKCLFLGKLFFSS